MKLAALCLSVGIFCLSACSSCSKKVETKTTESLEIIVDFEDVVEPAYPEYDREALRALERELEKEEHERNKKWALLGFTRVTLLALSNWLVV